MKNRFHKLLSFLGTAIMAALGFTNCDHFPFVMRCEYGTPQCDFKVDITVQNENGKALEGIKVIPAYNEQYYGGMGEQDYHMAMGKDTLTTDAKGKASHVYRVGSVPETIKVYFEDLDGDLNGGSFARDSAEFTPEKTGKGDNHWYQGEWTASGTKTLKKQ